MKKLVKNMLSVVLSVIMISVMGVSVRATTNIDDSELLDTHEDDGVPGILEKDDFESPEEYQEYLEKNPEAQIQAYAAKASPNKTVTAKATLKYKITGLPSTNVIQKTYIATKYIYVVQKSGDNTFLSRCLMNGSTAVHVDHMKLTNFGHGQTLEWFEHNGTPYFWVTCKANTAFEARWGIQIGRIKYEAGKTVDYTGITRFANLNYANRSGTSFGNIKRVDAALSSDRKKIIFWVMSTEGKIQYSFYNADKMNSLLDKKINETSKYVSCKDSAVKSACYSAFVQSGDNRVLPNDSCQGVELSDGDSIYIIGGNKGEIPQIAKMTGSGTSYKYSYLAKTSHTNYGKGTESEGIQLRGDYIYFGVCDKSRTDKYCIYSIPKSAF